jgi:glycosyl transferase family 25
MLPLSTTLISLKRSENRRHRAVAALQATPYLSWEILDGIDGLQMQYSPPEYHEAKVVRLLGFPLTASEIGCFLSHRQAWIKCVESNRPFLILEDDFLIQDNLEQAISILLNQYQDWDIARLQALSESPDETLHSGSDFKIVRNYGDPLGATAYIIKPAAAKRLIANSNEIYEPLDHFLEHQKVHLQNIVAFKPYPIQITGSQSTMHDRTDRTPITGFRKKMRSLHRAIDRFLNVNPWFPK